MTVSDLNFVNFAAQELVENGKFSPAQFNVVVETNTNRHIEATRNKTPK